MVSRIRALATSAAFRSQSLLILFNGPVELPGAGVMASALGSPWLQATGGTGRNGMTKRNRRKKAGSSVSGLLVARMTRPLKSSIRCSR